MRKESSDGLDQFMARLVKKMATDNVDTESLILKLALYNFSREPHMEDLYGCADTAGLDFVAKLVNFFPGQTIRVPTKKEFLESLVTSIVYFYTKFKGESRREAQRLYSDIPELKPFLDNSRINKLMQELEQSMTETIKVMVEGREEGFADEVRGFLNKLKEEDIDVEAIFEELSGDGDGRE